VALLRGDLHRGVQPLANPAAAHGCLAACFTVQNYLAEAGTIGALVRDSWDPRLDFPLPAATRQPTQSQADGSGTHTTVQDAITQPTARAAAPASTSW